MVKPYIKWFRLTNKFIYLLLLLGGSLLSQDYLQLKVNTLKDENTWKWLADINAQYQFSNSSNLFFTNTFSARYLQLRNSTQIINNFALKHQNMFNNRFDLSTGLYSNIIADDESFQDYSMHTLEISPRYRFSPLITAAPFGGIGNSTQREHEDNGWVYGLDLEGNANKLTNSNSGYFFDSRVEDFGPRQNRRFDAKLYWVPELSEAARDSFAVGYFLNYNENYISGINDDIETNGKDQQYISNVLTYRLASNLDMRMFSILEWKNLDRFSPLASDRRNEFALENRIFWILRSGGSIINWNIRFRNEQKQGSNTAINSETRFTALQMSGIHLLGVNHHLSYRFYLSKYETDTPVSQQLDRDELRWAVFGAYDWQAFPWLALLAEGEITNAHQVYLYAKFSNNNYQNQVYRVKGGIRFTPIRTVKNTLFYGLETNYNIFDFEELDPILKSRLVKSWSITDTLEIELSSKLKSHYIGWFNFVGLGNFDPQEILFYRNLNRITHRHMLKMVYKWAEDFDISLSFTLYRFEQVDPVNNYQVQNRQTNLMPQVEALYLPTTATRLIFFLQFNNNEITNFIPVSTVQQRLFTRANIIFEYMF